MAAGGEGLGWAVGVDGPEPEVGEDLRDDLGLVKECNDPHRAATAGAQQGIGLIHLFDQPSPPLFEGPASRGTRDLDEHFRRSVLPLEPGNGG